MSSPPQPRRDGYEAVHGSSRAATARSGVPPRWRQFNRDSDNPNSTLRDEKLAADITTQPSVLKRLHIKPWVLEILGLALSILSFVAICVILRVYEDRAVLELGLPRGLSLNAIIAALATIARAGLMIPLASSLMQELWLYLDKEASKPQCSAQLRHLDMFASASSGAWGSLMLVIQIHGRRIFASLAAMVIILSLAFSTFVQQAVVYDRRVDLSTKSTLNPGTIPRIDAWIDYEGRASEGYLAPPYPVLTALYESAFGTHIDPPKIGCQTGNCTWPLTPSLAVCGGCVSQQPTKKTCFTEKGNDTLAYWCNYTMPSGSVLKLWDFDKPQIGSTQVGFAVASNSEGTYYKVQNDYAYFANFDIMGAPFNAFPSQVIQQDMQAFERALWMCVQVYNVTVDTGKLIQDVVYQLDELNTHGFDPTGNVTFKPLPDIKGVRGIPQFTVGSMSILALSSFFGGQPFGTPYGNVMTGNISLSGQVIKAPSSYLMTGIWHGTQDIDAWITNMARSLSNSIRTYKPLVDSRYNGTAQAIGVHVRWAWLVLPLILVALTALVLVSAILRTASSPVKAWKGSPLAFLLFDVDHRVRSAACDRGSDRSDLLDAVGEEHVRFVQDGGTLWKFQSC